MKFSRRPWQVLKVLFVLASSLVSSAAVAAQTWAVRPDMLTPRWGFAAVYSHKRIYVFGGNVTNTSVTDKCEKYCPGAGLWKSIPDMPTGRRGLAAAKGPDGTIYVAGGRTGPTLTDVMEAYDPVSNTWASKTPVPVLRSHWAAAPGPNGKLYFFGGANTAGNWKDQVWEFDPAANAGLGSWLLKNTMPAGPRDDLAATLGCNGLIYVTGGDSTLTSGLIVEVYDPVLDQWVTGGPGWAPNLNVPMWGHGAVTTHDGTIHVVGAASYNNSNEVIQTFTPGVSTSWTTVADGTSTSMPTGRWLGSGLAVVSTGATIYTMGGTNHFNSHPEMVHSFFGALGPKDTACSTLFPTTSPFICWLRAFALLHENVLNVDLGGTPGDENQGETLVLSPDDPSRDYVVRVELEPTSFFGMEWLEPEAPVDPGVVGSLELDVRGEVDGETNQLLGAVRLLQAPDGSGAEIHPRFGEIGGEELRVEAYRGGELVLSAALPPDAVIRAARLPSGFSLRSPAVEDGSGVGLRLSWSGEVAVALGSATVVAEEIRFLAGVFGLPVGALSSVTLRAGGFPSLTVVNESVEVVGTDGGESFRRADSNVDGRVDLADSIFSLRYLFVGGTTPPCQDAADSNADDRLDIGDPIFTLTWYFLGGSEPSVPGPFDCGPGPGGSLGCEAYNSC